jgi:hypothetical protein
LPNSEIRIVSLYDSGWLWFEPWWFELQKLKIEMQKKPENLKIKRNANRANAHFQSYNILQNYSTGRRSTVGLQRIPIRGIYFFLPE